LRRFRLAVLLALTAAGPALAHDFWIQPEHFWLAPGAGTPVSIVVGHGSFRQRSPVSLERITGFRSIGPDGVVDRRPDLRGRPDTQDPVLAFKAPGVYMLALDTNSTPSDLPGLRFTDYLKVEGLTPALKLREQTGATDAPGRELFSRRAKAIVQVGPVDARPQVQAQALARVTQPLGLTLEIVPERNPYAPDAGDTLPVRIYYEGHPLTGALVKLNNLEFDARPVETHLSDADGRASFRVPRTGTWQLNVIWTRPIKGDPRADFETTFSSLTFGFPPGGYPRQG